MFKRLHTVQKANSPQNIAAINNKFMSIEQALNGGLSRDVLEYGFELDVAGSRGYSLGRVVKEFDFETFDGSGDTCYAKHGYEYLPFRNTSRSETNVIGTVPDNWEDLHLTGTTELTVTGVDDATGALFPSAEDVVANSISFDTTKICRESVDGKNRYVLHVNLWVPDWNEIGGVGTEKGQAAYFFVNKVDWSRFRPGILDPTVVPEFGDQTIAEVYAPNAAERGDRFYQKFWDTLPLQEMEYIFGDPGGEYDAYIPFTPAAPVKFTIDELPIPAPYQNVVAAADVWYQQYPKNGWGGVCFFDGTDDLGYFRHEMHYDVTAYVTEGINQFFVSYTVAKDLADMYTLPSNFTPSDASNVGQNKFMANLICYSQFDDNKLVDDYV